MPIEDLEGCIKQVILGEGDILLLNGRTDNGWRCLSIAQSHETHRVGEPAKLEGGRGDVCNWDVHVRFAFRHDRNGIQAVDALMDELFLLRDRLGEDELGEDD